MTIETEAVKVKALRWRKYGNQHGTGWQGIGAIGYLQYIVDRGPDGEEGWFWGDRGFDTEDQAKAAAQSDYEQCILSALTKGEAEECQTCFGTGKEGRHSICRDCDELAAARERQRSLTLKEAERLRSRIAELEAALEPFAKAGQVIDGPFGPALFAEDDMAFQSGCAWSENGERKTITWGDFRRARAAIRALIPEREG
ncbi:hypothetical protein [Rhizobium leguminosarum]|uniref:hypothetical protein n=1 Tax=Rhizobium leguminosarum TaxID=384 RepID=UPI001C91821B|nr:hypothetical protein [Rhizobium leguminosarum]MBY2986435.1 hypothetical protein [Rhizobium leguminosarum]